MRALNIVLAAAGLVGAATFYWFLWRPLPESSGSAAAPVSAEVRIVRDGRGVPHIEAGSIEDALFAQGYATAQDRLWQMDLLRRAARGELSEIVGRPALALDITSRRLRMGATADAQVRRLPAADRAALAAYARGVNHFIDTHRHSLPLEFTLLAYDPRPWQAADTWAIGLEMFRTLTGFWEGELAHTKLLEGADLPRLEELYPYRAGGESLAGSNAWVVSGKWTASGKPVLANDPHLEFQIPSIWHQVHLRAPGLNVAGVTLPGVPAVIIGHNEQIAWGVTNLGFDVMDLYSERIDLASGRYLAGGAVRQAARVQEYIAVKNSPPVEFAAWQTHHGVLWNVEGGRSFTLRWTASELPPGGGFALLDINRATDWTSFRAALRRFSGPGQNFVYADRAGNIGYQATGLLPIRKGHDGGVVADGAAGAGEWQGFIPFDELPSIYNPPSGLLVTANQNPFPTGYPHLVSGVFAPPGRKLQIEALLKARRGWKAAEMLAVQKDVYSAIDHLLARESVAAFDRRQPKNPGLAEAVNLLRGWNGQMEKGTPQPLLTSLLYLKLRRALAQRASPKHADEYKNWMASAVLTRLLAERPAAWFQDWDKLLLDSLADAADEARRLQGRNLAKWDYGAYNQLTIAHPVGRGLGWLGEYFNIGPVAMSGSSATVKQTTRRIGPSMRFVADLANWDASLLNLTAGESGHVLSRRYKDHWKAYYDGTSFPLPFERVEPAATLRLTPR